MKRNFVMKFKINIIEHKEHIIEPPAAMQTPKDVKDGFTS